MSDRELLEKAAKAAGRELETMKINCGDGVAELVLNWNPLANDGDALRLAVKLKICVEFGYCADDAPVVYCGPVEERPDWPGSNCFPDPFAATRRAIVRAAAAMVETV